MFCQENFITKRKIPSERAWTALQIWYEIVIQRNFLDKTYAKVKVEKLEVFCPPLYSMALDWLFLNVCVIFSFLWTLRLISALSCSQYVFKYYEMRDFLLYFYRISFFVFVLRLMESNLIIRSWNFFRASKMYAVVFSKFNHYFLILWNVWSRVLFFIAVLCNYRVVLIWMLDASLFSVLDSINFIVAYE